MPMEYDSTELNDSITPFSAPRCEGDIPDLWRAIDHLSTRPPERKKAAAFIGVYADQGALRIGCARTFPFGVWSREAAI